MLMCYMPMRFGEYKVAHILNLGTEFRLVSPFGHFKICGRGLYHHLICGHREKTHYTRARNSTTDV